MPNELYGRKKHPSGCFFHALTATYPKNYPLFFTNPTQKTKKWRTTDLQKVGEFLLC